MGIIKDRRIAIAKLKDLTKNPDQVFIIHYTQLKSAADENDSISPLISAIVIKSLDGKREIHFGIHLEADKGNVAKEDINSQLRDLELRVLKSFNDFVRRHNNCIWVHWDMKNIHFGFEAIKHRFEKIFSGLKDRFEEIPHNRKVNLCHLMEGAYGENFAEGPDKMASLLIANNGMVPNNDLLTLEAEGVEFERRNYSSVLNSVDCRVDFMIRAIKLLRNNKLIVPNKNRYSIFIDFITHPIFNLFGWIFGAIGVGALFFI